MQILISGGTGLIGRKLSKQLVDRGNRVIILTRQPNQKRDIPDIEFAGWDGKTSTGLVPLVEKTDAVIHLAGENIGALPWSPRRKDQLLESRLSTSQAMLSAFKQANKYPPIFLQASAIGIYGTSLHATFNEASPLGNDFLADLAGKWENSTKSLEEFDVRRVLVRTGLVLDAQEGVLPKWMLPFRFFMGGPLGNGHQWQSWIHIKDEINALIFLLENNQARGPVNLTAPNPVRNAELEKMIGKVMSRPAWIPAPAFVLKAILGEMSTLVLEGQRVLPARLNDLGYRFEYPDLEPALYNLISGR